MTGRLFAHLRQEELRQAVQDINDKETSVSAGADLSTTQIKEKGVWVDHFEYDDQFKLPYGVGYDHVIKKRTDMIDKQKFWNNRVMDELVESLGYMDYRDALACKKYTETTISWRAQRSWGWRCLATTPKNDRRLSRKPPVPSERSQLPKRKTQL